MATRRIENTQESRRLLLTAAAELFAEKGYRRTSFIDIGERAGVSRGSIPWHFGNKPGLLKAVVEEHLAAALAGFDRAAEGSADERLDAVVAFIRMPATRLFIALLSEAVEDDSPIREHYARLHAALRESVRSRLPADALPPGTDAESFTVLLVGTVIGVHAQWRIAPETVDLDAVAVALRAVFPGVAGR